MDILPGNKERSISGFYFKDHIMKDTLINRREFLKNIGVLGAGVLLSASPWLSAFSEVKETSNEKCRLAVIGPGSRGRFLMSFLIQNPKVDIVAL